MPERCRLCTANDEEALIDDLAGQLWESRRDGTLDDVPWVDAGSYWQRIFQDFARTAVGALR
jgi:hypothetical protein